MVTAYEVPADKIVGVAAKDLESRITQPEWSRFVKTGMGRERPPEQENWWYIRAGSLMRRIYIDGPVGISRLRSYYGSRHRRGHKPAHFAKSGGKILRALLQDLEKAGLVKKDKKGRYLTPEGQKFMDAAARKAAKGA